MKMMIEKYKPVESKLFKRGRKQAVKRRYDLSQLKWAIDQLAQDIPLPKNWKDHPLKGSMKKYRECHIGGSGDWLLIYEKRKSVLILYLYGTGSHAVLFE